MLSDYLSWKTRSGGAFSIGPFFLPVAVEIEIIIRGEEYLALSCFLFIWYYAVTKQVDVCFTKNYLRANVCIFINGGFIMKGHCICKKILLCFVLFAFVFTVAIADVEKDEDGGIWDWDNGIYTAPDGSTYKITSDGDNGESTGSSDHTSTSIIAEQEQTKETDKSENNVESRADTTKLTGWQQNNGKWYYYDPSGVMSNNGWLWVDGIWYYFRADGAMATGWVNDGGTWYYMKSDGTMATGWIEDSGNWYLLNKDGSLYTGWIAYGKTWYLLKPSGAMATNWYSDGGTWYYFGSDGAMRTGWVQINGQWEMFSNNGAWLYTWDGK